MQIAIIGGGIAGLTCASGLQQRGHGVVVYEKEAGPGGRIGTMETELGGFDHGAQYFTAQSEPFSAMTGKWLEDGWIAPWQARLVALENGRHKPTGGGPRYVAVPGMRALATRLASGLDVRTGQLVRRIASHEGKWLLSVHADTVPIDASAGPFDVVVVAAPADQAVPLLQVAPKFAKLADQSRLAPCWSLVLAFQQPLDLDYDGAWVGDSRLGWIARDTSKPQRRPGEHWVAQATPDWSRRHLEDDPERVREKLLKAFRRATGSEVRPVYSALKCWHYAQALKPSPVANAWDAKLRIGACGDWFAAGLEGAGRIENAWLSAAALAETISVAVA